MVQTAAFRERGREREKWISIDGKYATSFPCLLGSHNRAGVLCWITAEMIIRGAAGARLRGKHTRPWLHPGYSAGQKGLSLAAAPCVVLMLLLFVEEAIYQSRVRITYSTAWCCPGDYKQKHAHTHTQINLETNGTATWTIKQITS